jgi:hypothetical protein
MDHRANFQRRGSCSDLPRLIMKPRAVTNGLGSFAVGSTGGLIGLGAELRLRYLASILRLSPHQTVPMNFAISLCLFAQPFRLGLLP